MSSAPLTCLALGLALALAFGDVHGAETAPRMLLLDGELAGQAVIVVGERGSILRSGGGAQAWQSAPRATNATLTGLTFVPASGETVTHGWAVGHDALILATTDAGQTWAQQYQGENVQDSFLDVLALDARHVIAVGAYALYVETQDGGKSWATRKIGDGDFHFNRLTRGPSGTLYLAGERGTLLKSSDAGATWASIATPYDGSFYGVLPLGATTLLAYGLRGHVFRSTDDGASWERIATPQPVVLAAAVKMKTNTLVLAGSAGTLLVSRDDGKNFASAGGAATKAIAQLVELPDGNLLALGESGATVITLPR